MWPMVSEMICSVLNRALNRAQLYFHCQLHLPSTVLGTAISTANWWLYPFAVET